MARYNGAAKQLQTSLGLNRLMDFVPKEHNELIARCHHLGAEVQSDVQLSILGTVINVADFTIIKRQRILY